MFIFEGCMKAPHQARSRETLERMLGAVEELLSERLFEDLTIADAAGRAGVAVGTFYTRFKTKDELLPALFERHDAAVGERVAGLLQKVAAERDARLRIGRIVAFAVDYHQQHRGLLRALTMYVRAHPESVPAQAWRERAGQYRAVAQVLIGDGQDFRDAKPLVACEFALGVVNSVCREQVLFDDVTPLRGRRSLRALERHLTQMLVRDLLVDSSAP